MLSKRKLEEPREQWEKKFLVKISQKSETCEKAFCKDTRESKVMLLKTKEKLQNK